jgi:hypothetical protein
MIICNPLHQIDPTVVLASYATMKNNKAPLKITEASEALLMDCSSLASFSSYLRINMDNIFFNHFCYSCSQSDGEKRKL